jgi:LemA protein
MLPTIIAVISILALIILWVISTQRRLVMLDENISNAMNQIEVQLSSRFDALTALLNLTRSCSRPESDILIDSIKSVRKAITAKSTPEDIMLQEKAISNALDRIAVIAEQYSELKTNQSYIYNMDAVHTFENMLRTSRLIYNDCVSKLNREVRMFPSSIIAGMIGFRQKKYLE